MSQPTTLILLPQTAYSGNAATPTYTVTGDKVAAAAYYISCKDTQTVNINTTNLVGNIIIQASLATTPSSTAIPPDWFTLHTIEANVNAVANSLPQLAANTNVGLNLTGSFVWMRAVVEDFSGGIVNWIKVSY